jgi:hypothetical protein
VRPSLLFSLLGVGGCWVGGGWCRSLWGAFIGRNLNVLYMVAGITMPTSPCINSALFKPANASIYLAIVENFSYFICRNCMVGAVHSISSLISIILIL